MARENHISLEDIAGIFENEKNAFADEAKMQVLFKHLATCDECLEKLKAHRRLEILLEHWSSDLHGQAYKKMEYLKELKASKQAAEGEDEDEEMHDHDDEYDEDYSDDN